MSTRVLLLAAPLALVAALMQAYFWVPTYPEQTRADPARLETFIEGSGADAKVLNPILAADSASFDIIGLVFEGLLEYDESLKLEPRLATGWELRERISVAALDYARLADGGTASLQRLRANIEVLVDRDPALRERLIAIETEAPAVRTATIAAAAGDAGAAASDDASPGPQRELLVELEEPARVTLEFRDVNPDFAAQLESIVGPGYARRADVTRHLRGARALDAAALEAAAAALTPAVTHKPVIEFRIRRGVRFHDGHELDAGDVRFTYEAIMNPKNLSPRTSDFEPIESVEAVGSHAVRVTYKRLFSPAVTAWTMPLLPEHLLNDDRMREEMDERGLSDAARESFGMRDARFNLAPVGTGPFKFEQWRANEFVHLVANEDHWRATPNYENLYYRILPDAVTREFEFRAGAVDHYLAEPHQAERYARTQTYRALESTALAYSYIGYNLRRAPFSDVRVRRALGMALDVDEIIEHVLYGQGERVTGPYPIATPWYDRGVRPLPYDPEKAKRLLADAGWHPNADGMLEKNGKVLEFNLITNSGNQKRKTIMSVAQSAWRRIGVRCNTQLFEWPVFLEDFVNPGDFDALVLGWGMTPDADLYQLFHSSQTGPRQLNFAGYESEEADRLIEAIRVTYDPDALASLTRALHARMAGDQPYTFLYAPTATHVLDRKIVERAGDAPAGPVRLGKTEGPLDRIHAWIKLAHVPDF